MDKDLQDLLRLFGEVITESKNPRIAMLETLVIIQSKSEPNRLDGNIGKVVIEYEQFLAKYS